MNATVDPVKVTELCLLGPEPGMEFSSAARVTVANEKQGSRTSPIKHEIVSSLLLAGFDHICSEDPKVSIRYPAMVS